MIARIWKGRTRVEQYEEYTEFIRRNAIPDYSSTEGFIGLSFLRKKTDTEAHFTPHHLLERRRCHKAVRGRGL